MTSEIIILYQPKQIGVILSFFGKQKLLENNRFCIIALDYEVELVLRKQSIPYKSVQQYLDPNKLDNIYNQALKIGREWFKTPEMEFFQHSGILLGGIKEPYFKSYIYTILYHLEIFSNIFDKHPGIKRVWIPQSVFITPTAGPIAPFAYKVPVDITILLGKIKGFSVSIIPRNQQQFIKKRTRSIIRKLITSFFLFGLSFINFIVTITRPSKKLKIFIIDHWRNVKPFIGKMNNVELVMMVRKEILRMGLGQVWEKRVRFHHPKDFLTSEIRKIACDKQKQFRSTWFVVSDRPKFYTIFQYRGISFWTIVKPVISRLVIEDAEEMIHQIEGISRLLAHFSINRILLRASTKDQFYITAKLSHQLEIPSVELQHGIVDSEYLFGFSPVKVDYLVAYGKLTKEILVRDGNDPRQIIGIGSPRFDHYVVQRQDKKNIEVLRSRLKIDSSRPVILFLVPAIMIPIKQSQGLTTYELIEMFQAIIKLQKKMPGLQVILKLRPTSTREQFYRKAAEIFKEDVIIAQYEDMKTLLSLSDVVVSGKSTVILEAMIVGKPIVLYTLRKGASQFRLFKEAGALRIANTLEEIPLHILSLLSDEEARKNLVKNANNFLEKHYLFDGKSSERIIKLLKDPERPESI